MVNLLLLNMKRSVCLSVCLSVFSTITQKTTRPIAIKFKTKLAYIPGKYKFAKDYLNSYILSVSRWRTF